MKTGAELITDERNRQIYEEGWTKKHDAEHLEGDLAMAGVCYAFEAVTLNKQFIFDYWPWSPQWWKPTPDDKVSQLVKAGALIAAEIDRIQNKQVTDILVR
jgi:hypothetical protein